MPLLFKDKKTKRRDTLNGLLDLEVVHKNKRFDKFFKFFRERYKVILISAFVLYSAAIHIHYFNALTVMEQQVTNTKAQIESGLQMRQNLVPALTTVVYQFITHEKNVFLSAVKARENSLSASAGMDKLMGSLKELTGTEFSKSSLSRFMAVAENYPQLVSSGSYQLLIGRIAEVENQIFTKRLEYNNAVNQYNTRLCTFPVNMLGRVMGFRIEPYFTWTNKPEWVFVTNPESGELPVSMKAEDSDQ